MKSTRVCGAIGKRGQHGLHNLHGLHKMIVGAAMGRGIVVALAVSSVAAPAVAQPTPTPTPGFTLIQQIGGGGSPFVFADAFGIADDGSALVGTVDAASPAVADGGYLWTASGGFQVVASSPPLGGYGLSGNAAFGYYAVSNVSAPRRRNNATGQFEVMGMPAGFQYGRPRAATFTGDISVGEVRASFGSVPQPVRWNSANQPSVVPMPAGFTVGIAFGINDAGTRIVGTGATPEGFSRAFVWDSVTGPSLLPLPAGSPSNFREAVALSGDGRWVVGTAINASGQQVSTRWDLQTGNVLPLPPVSGYTAAVGKSISDDGSIVTGTLFLPSGAERSFVWTEAAGMMTSQDYFNNLGLAPGSDVFWASRFLIVSGDGTAFGGVFTLERPSGELYGGVGLVRIPAPGAAALTLGLIAYVGCRRRRVV